jgi:hypothetical protein
MDLQTILSALVGFVGTKLVSFLMGIAFVVFIWNVFRYFIMGGANEEARTQAKSLAIWGILAFVFIASLWGIVNFIRGNFGIGDYAPTAPDYMQERRYGAPPEVDPNNPCSASVDLEDCMTGGMENTV